AGHGAGRRRRSGAARRDFAKGLRAVLKPAGEDAFGEVAIRSFDPDALLPAALAADENASPPRHLQSCGQKLQQRLVGGALDGARLESDLDRVRVKSLYFRPARARLRADLQLEICSVPSIEIHARSIGLRRRRFEKKIIFF